MEDKKFMDWIRLKAKIHFHGIYRNMKEGDVWWCSMGENIGVEINGKHEYFLRPVLVYKKLSRFGFMGIPLTSQPHIGSWYVRFVFQGRVEYGVLSQARVFSAFRLYRKMGAVSDPDMMLLKEGFKKLYC